LRASCGESGFKAAQRRQHADRFKLISAFFLLSRDDPPHYQGAAIKSVASQSAVRAVKKTHDGSLVGSAAALKLVAPYRYPPFML